MIKFQDYDDIIKEIYADNQDHVFEYWDELSETDKKMLLDELSDIDFSLIKKLYINASEQTIKKKYKPSPYIAIPDDSYNKDYYKAEKTGREFILEGKTAALLVAGGQGTRLGYDGPKGKFPIGPVSGKSLFQIHAEKILKNRRKYGISIPWLIMTSKSNHNETVEYFSANDNFGLPKEDLFFFRQKMIPSLDMNGKLLLQTKSGLFMNPDGHGGTLTALADSNLLKKMKDRGIEIFSYFQVDNPLVKIIDPVFIGFHVLNASDVSSKAAVKTGPDEKVGVFVEYDNGKTGIIEYSDMTDGEKNARDGKGKLLYSMGNIAVHLFNTAFIESITSGKELSLPYHTANKKIEAYFGNTIKEINGLKFEKFIFDALSLTSKNTILEIKREDEFAPVKNAEGIDSPESAKFLMNELHKKWLKERNIFIPEAVKTVEISPLMAAEPPDLPDIINIPSKETVYLE